MKHTHGHHTLSTMAKTLTHKDDVHFLAYIEVMSVLGKFWPERFTSTEFLVLVFLVNRTLIFRKRAEIITRKQFMEGIQSGRGVTCSGVGVSDTARIKALNSLCENDFIHIHCFMDNHIESVPRIYELNYEALVHGYDLGEVQNMLKRSRKLTREAPDFDDFDGDLTPPKSSTPPPLNLGGITELLHSSNKSSSNEEESTAARSSEPALKIGKHRRAGAINCTPTTVPVTGDARERLAQIQQQQSRTRSNRVATAKSLPARRWEMKDLQALLDEARSQAGVSVPRVMATAKGAGVLFKRMKEAEISDVLEFFTWAFANWGTVANANRRAKARQMKETKAVQSEMSMIPNFAELAYRFPYILAFFNDRKYTKVQEEQQQAARKSDIRQAQEQQEQAIDERRQRVRAEDRRRQEEDRRDQQERVERRSGVRRRTRTLELADVLDDDDIPEYKEREWRGK